MPKLVAVDTGPLVGLFARNDRYHAAAVSFFREFRDAGVVTVPVIAEVMWLLDFRVDAQLDFLRWIRRGALKIVDLLEDDWDRIAKLTEKYADLPIDFADSAIVATCERLGIRSIASCDHHFEIYRYKDRQAFRNIFPL